ncbi:MAG: hypothetical protein ABFS35_20795 [Bacteroidota bacterium]
MLSFYTIWTVAKFEMRTLLRGWFFRIFAGLAILSIGGFNIAVFVDASGAPWIYRALPASIPYANLIILNLGQAIVAIFLASEFLKQDKKNDTIEVIYARSMTNAEYILGKTFGILLVFFFLNLVILLIGIGFSFLSSDSSREILTYFYYPFLISLPTLVFILGLSFFLMVTIKNQAITFILLLGYIALSIFYLDHKFYHLADFIAYNVPMIHSTIGGFGNIQETLLHRGLFFFIGLGLIFFTVIKIGRLPQSGKFRSLPIILTLVFLAIGGFLMKKYIDIKQGNIEFKKEMISLNNEYVSKPVVHIDSCDLELEHQGAEIFVKANLFISNQSKQSIDTLIFSLNPSLNILSAELEGKKVNYSRNLHILKIISSENILPGEKRKFTLSYRGKINENTHFIDQNLEDYEDNFSVELFRLRKRYAYLQDNFVCLTSESLWYPVSGVGHASIKPAVYLPDFTSYSLTVKTDESLTAVSQGKMNNLSAGVYQFKPEFPLPKISLLIADYKKYSIDVDSVEYSIYARDGNQYFEAYFNELADSLPQLIRELKNEYETFIDFKYPFNRFLLVEVPVQFSTDKHIWSTSSDAVQPEMILFPEKGVIMEETDFRKRKKREEDKMKRDNEDILPEELQARIFKRFIRGNFMATPKEWYQFREIVDRNTYTLFPNFYTYVTQIKSDRWPIINMAFEAYLRERNVSAEQQRRWYRAGISSGERINLELKQASLKELINKGVEKAEEEYERVTLNEVIVAKGNYLFSLFRARYGENEFNSFLSDIMKNNRHKSFDFKTIDSAMINVFHDTISSDVNNWYNKNDLAGFLVKDIENYKVMQGEYSKYQLRFKVANPEEVDGLITVSVEMVGERNRNNRDWDDLANVGFSRKILIPARSAKEIGFVFSSEPARMKIFTHISENLPNNLVFDFTDFDQLKKVTPFDGLNDYPMFTTIHGKNEIIVDNEDEGFEYRQVTNQSYLKSLIKKNQKQKYQYTGLRWWNPPGVWKSVLSSGFYGKYVRSALYTKTGDGNRIAIWNAKLGEAALYDVYCNIDKVESRRRRKKEKTNYNFKVFHDDGEEEISLQHEEIETGWNYLGTFYISADSAKVELNNKSIGNMVFADAIKWVKSK